MRRTTLAALLLCVTALVPPVRAQQDVLPEISLAQYLTELDRVRGLVDALDENRRDAVGGVLSRIPRAWRVSANGASFEVSTDWIRRELVDWQQTKQAATKDRLANRLRAVRADAAAYALRPRDATPDRDRLRQVLAAHEFQGLQGPTWLDRLRQRAMQWLIGILERVLGSSSIPTITNVIVYTAIAIVVALIAAWMYRSLRRSAELDSIRPDRVPQIARPWTVWLQEARDAAARNDWPQAVHLAYWCGISFLESQGAWRPDRSRTPRVYLRVLGASHQHRPALQALTRELEHVWYGAGGADASRFGGMLDQLKRLGCPSL